MKTMTKIAVLSASVLSLGALTACQSSNNVQSAEQTRMMKHHADKYEQKERRLSPEQRQQFEAARQQRAEFHKQIRQACDNKAVGSNVEIKAGDKTLTGTCNIYFQADRKQLKDQRSDYRAKGEQRPMRGDIRHTSEQTRGFAGAKHGEPLTDAQRAELVKQYDQRLAERQAKQKALIQACQGKKDAATAQIKVGEQTIHGKCHVRFQPKAPVAPAINK